MCIGKNIKRSYDMKDTVEKERIFASDLIEEIKILLPDYFECELTSNENSITFSFYNGQKFILNATEC